MPPIKQASWWVAPEMQSAELSVKTASDALTAAQAEG